MVRVLHNSMRRSQAPSAPVLQSVDQLNSLIDVKIGFGQFRVWKEFIAAFQKVRENADTVLTHTALTEEKLKKMWDVP